MCTKCSWNELQVTFERSFETVSILEVLVFRGIRRTQVHSPLYTLQIQSTRGLPRVIRAQHRNSIQKEGQSTKDTSSSYRHPRSYSLLTTTSWTLGVSNGDALRKLRHAKERPSARTFGAFRTLSGFANLEGLGCLWFVRLVRFVTLAKKVVVFGGRYSRHFS